ncbi:MAG: TRAP transporter small permease [Clostridiales Family XIII bacterium]|jgi:TRAP-type C4-dicarboxylate transport system permease small subunit|nr:TRAP transporter small permease [Clostridiales Family XIII bacterium]
MFLRKFNRICGYAAGAIILLSALVIMYDVVCRYFFNAPSLYAPYIAAFLMLGAVFIGTGYALQAGGHVFVELLVDKMRPALRRVSLTIGYAFSMVFVGALTRACWQFSVKAVQSGWKAQGNLPIPSVILYGVMTFGSALLLATLVMMIVELWRGRVAADGRVREDGGAAAERVGASG